MQIRRSTFKDIPEIMVIISDAKIHLAAQKIEQWQNGYPNAAQVENDIKIEESYVLVSEESKVVATAMFTTRKEPTYKVIEGKWKVDENQVYGVIHRMAIKASFRKLGLAAQLFKEFHQQLNQQKIQSLKIDTHEENVGMQSLIKKLGYQYCGIIYTNYGDKRMAFEKVL